MSPLHVVHDGPRRSPPLVLVHGSGAAGSTWGPMVPALSARHHVVRVDLPGCGQSPPAASYAVPDQARRVADVLDDLGLAHVTVVGHSSGGYVATSLAEQRPDLVGALVLVSTGPATDDLLPQRLLVRALTAPPLGPLLWSVRSDALTRRGVGALCHRPVDVPDDVVDDARRIAYRTLRQVLRGNTAYLAERGMAERLTALGVPVLVLFGAADPRWEPSSVHRYDTVPTARVEQLPEVGHLPMLEAPEATGRLVLRFAEEVTGPSR